MPTAPTILSHYRTGHLTDTREAPNRAPRSKLDIGSFETRGTSNSEIDINPNTNYNINNTFLIFHDKDVVTPEKAYLHHAEMYPYLASHPVPLIVNVLASGGIPIVGGRVFLEFTGDTNARVVDQNGIVYKPADKEFPTRNDGTVMIGYLPSAAASSPVRVTGVVKKLNGNVLIRTESVFLEI